MTTLVIGGGLIGSQVALILSGRGERVVIMDSFAQLDALSDVIERSVPVVSGSVLRPMNLTQIIREHNVTAIVHMAANPMLTVGAQQNPYGAIELNIMGAANVLEAARTFKLGRVVMASSCVLNHFMTGGEGRALPWKEEALPRPTTFYASTKQAVESLGLNYASAFGVDFIALRYGAVFGPWSGKGGGGPTNVIRSALENALHQREVLLPGTAVEWVYSRDAAMAAVQALNAPSAGSRVFNITMGEVCRPEDLAVAIRCVFPGADVRIEDPRHAGIAMPQMLGPSDLSLAHSCLGFTPQFPMPEAILDFANWLRSRHL